MKIIVVDDEPQMRLGLVKNLKFEGYEVDEASNGEEALQKILKEEFDLVILDVMMPKISGFDVCRKIRENGFDVPIIMLTAKGEEIDKILGLELGADDYLTKPFSLRELLTRVKVILRRYNSTKNSNGDFVKIGKLNINFGNFSVMDEDGKVQMTYREIEILKYLWEHRDKTVGRDEILDNVWDGNEIVTPRTIDNFIARLRQKIEIEPSKPVHIKTFHKVGYKLVM